MKSNKPVLINWDISTKSGSITLLIKESIIKRYGRPLVVTAKQGDILQLNYPINKHSEYEKVSQEIANFYGTLAEYKLINKNESEFHASHILHMLINFNIGKDSDITQQKIKERLLARMVFLTEFKKISPTADYKYQITITSDKGFKYSLSDERIVTNNLLNKLQSSYKNYIRKHEGALYKMLLNDASEKEFKAFMSTVSEHKINKYLIAKLIKQLLDYLNNESIHLRNPNSSKYSVTNDQGNFIYDLLTAFKIYKPKKVAEAVVMHHNSIRKLLVRSDI